MDKAIELRFCGGMYGEPQKPTEFIALLLKMLQIQPEKDIILEFIKNDDFKILRLLGAFYMRLTGRPQEVYRYLEPLLNDYRRVRLRDRTGNFCLSHIDELVDDMLRVDYMFSIALPKLPSRTVLEATGQLEPRKSVLADEFEALVAMEQDERAKEEAKKRDVEAQKEREDQRRREKWRLSRKDKNHRRDRRSRSRSTSTERSRGRRDDRHERRRFDRRDRRYRSRSRSLDGDEERERKRRHTHRRSDADERDFRDDRNRSNGISEGKETLSVEETNKLRASLGLPPLK